MSLSNLVLYVMFAAAITVAVDIVAAFFAKDVPGLLLTVFFFACAIMLIFLQVNLLPLMLLCFALLIVAALTVKIITRVFRNNASYHKCPDTKEQLFAGKKVLVQVPHEDDEILVAGGVIEEYIKVGKKADSIATLLKYLTR